MPDPVIRRPDELSERHDIGPGVSSIHWTQYWVGMLIVDIRLELPKTEMIGSMSSSSP